MVKIPYILEFTLVIGHTARKPRKIITEFSVFSDMNKYV